MKISRRLLPAVAAATALALLGACGGGGGGGTDVLHVTLPNHPWADFIKPKIAEFEEANGVKVELTSGTADQVSATYNVKLNAGATDLDVLMYRPLQEHVQFARNGWLANIDEYVNSSSDYDFGDFQPATVETTSFDGSVYGIPIVTEREVLFYRKDLFEAAGIDVPTTMAELEAAAEALHDPGNNLYAYGMRGQRTGAVTQFSGFLYSHGGDFIVDGQAAVNTPEAVEAYEIYGRLLREYGPTGVVSMSTEQLNPLFQQGQLAMYIDAEVFWAELIREGTSSIEEDQLGVAPLPAGPAGSKPYNVPSWALTINEKSQNKDMAWKFVEWATSKDMVLALQQGGIMGARKSVWDNPASLEGIPDDFAETLRYSVENGVGHDRPLVVQVGRARDIVGGPIVASIEGKDVQAAADEAQAELEKFLVEDASATGVEE